MKTITVTDFRKRVSGSIAEVERGEKLILLSRGKSVAEVVLFSDESKRRLGWKQPGIRLRIRGSDLSSAILDECGTDR